MGTKNKLVNLNNHLFEELEKQNAEKQEHIVELERIVEQQEVKINEQYVELDSLRETVYMYQVYGK